MASDTAEGLRSHDFARSGEFYSAYSRAPHMRGLYRKTRLHGPIRSRRNERGRSHRRGCRTEDRPGTPARRTAGWCGRLDGRCRETSPPRRERHRRGRCPPGCDGDSRRARRPRHVCGARSGTSPPRVPDHRPHGHVTRTGESADTIAVMSWGAVSACPKLVRPVDQLRDSGVGHAY